ncbi:MAG: XrtA/PEP-CTERM system TPR-repeat protein PrsT [Thiobacillus sp.]
MTKPSAALAIALALASSTALTACDSTANLTEQEHIQRAKDLEDKGNLKGSIVELKNALLKNPNSPQSRLLLGQIYLKAGKGAEAEKELSLAEKLGVNRESIKPQLGEALLLMGEFKRVLDEIQPGDQTSKTNLARIYQIRANAMINQGQLKDACNLYQQSLDTDATNPPTYWGLAQCAVAERNMMTAREWLDAALKLKHRQTKTWTYIGDWEQLNQNPPGALAAYASALKIEPNDLEALQNRATLNIMLDHPEAARTDIDKIGKLAPKSLASNYLQALLNFYQKKYPEARDSLQAVFKIMPEHMPSVLLAGITEQALGAHQQAESYLNRFLVRSPGNAFARRALAFTQTMQNQPDKALETLAPLLASQTDSQALVIANEAYKLKNEPDKAMSALEMASRIDPKNVALQTQLGFIQLTSGDTVRAMSSLQAASTLNPGQQEVQSLLVLTYLKSKEYSKAHSLINAMEKIRPLTADMLVMRAEAYLGTNNLQQARASLEQALVDNPVYFPAAAALARLDMHAKNPEGARNHFIAILNKDPRHLQSLMALAELAEINKQEKMQLDWLDKAVKARPQSIAPRAALVRYFLARKDPKKALSAATEAVKANRDSPEALNLLGSTQLALNDASNAATTFEKLTQMGRPSSDAYLNLALAQLASNNFSVARNNLRKALALEPANMRGLDTMIKLDLVEKKPDAALQTARQMQMQHAQSPLGFDREGDIHMAQKQPALAARAYEHALSLDDDVSGLIKLHRALTLSDSHTLADTRLLNGIKQHPDDSRLHAYAAEYYMVNGRNRESIAQYEYLIKQQADNVLYLNNLAALYQREKDYGHALDSAERAYRLAPKNPAIQDTLGWILVEKGNPKRGLALLRQAATGAPASASIRYHLATALARNGDTVQARKLLLDVLRESPKFPEAKEARALLDRL